MKKQLFTILSVFFILMAGFGIGMVAAEDSATDAGSDNSVSDTSSGTSSDSGSDTSSDNSVSDSSSDSASDTSTDNSVSDSSSDSASDTSTDNSVSDSGSDTDDGSSTDDSSVTDDTSSDNSPSTDDSTSDDSVDDSTTDESNNADDTTEKGSTDESGDSVDDGVEDIIDNGSDTMVVGKDDPAASDDIVLENPIVIGPTINDTNTSSDDDTINNINDADTNITQTTNIENSTIDNSYKSWTNFTETKNLKIDNRQYTDISFTDKSVVNNITFISKESGNTKVIVKEVHDKPPVKNVYKSFNIQIDNKDVANNVENAVVDFKVEKSWLKANGLDKSSIVLNMYDNGKWIEVPITITCEDSKYIYFKAKVSKYSTFAITGKTVVVDKVTKQSDSQNNGNSDEEIDGTTKNVVVKLLKLVIELIEGK